MWVTVRLAGAPFPTLRLVDTFTSMSSSSVVIRLEDVNKALAVAVCGCKHSQELGYDCGSGYGCGHMGLALVMAMLARAIVHFGAGDAISLVIRKSLPGHPLLMK